MKLIEYMRRIEKIYKDAAPKYLEAAQKEKENREAIEGIRASSNLTYEGKQKQIAALTEQGNAIRAEMAAYSAQAREQALEVRQEVERRFYGHFHATPQDIDMPALELLKSGILTDTELKNLANSYSNNATMRRLIGRTMEQRDSRELQQMGRLLRANATEPHLQCVDSIMQVGEYCLGGGRTKGASCEVFLQRFDEMTAPTYAAAPDIEG